MDKLHYYVHISCVCVDYYLISRKNNIIKEAHTQTEFTLNVYNARLIIPCRFQVYTYNETVLPATWLVLSGYLAGPFWFYKMGVTSWLPGWYNLAT